MSLRQEAPSFDVIKEKLKTSPIIRPPLIIPGNDGFFHFDGWEIPAVEILERKGEEIDSSRFTDYAQRAYCDLFGYQVGKFEVVGKGDVVKSFEIIDRKGRLNIVSSIVDASGRRIYNLEEVIDGQTAIVLQQILSKFTNSFPSIGISPNYPIRYFPEGLKLPRFISETQLQLMDSDYQTFLIGKAVEFAQRLGLTVSPRDGLSFSENGLLDGVTVRPGEASLYYFDRGDHSYAEHNVDTPEQAITLHWVCGTFIRDLKQRFSS